MWAMCPHPGEHYTQEDGVDQEDRLRSHPGNMCAPLSRKKRMLFMSPKEQVTCDIMIFVAKDHVPLLQEMEGGSA